jgi:hypothetical protein
MLDQRFVDPVEAHGFDPVEDADQTGLELVRPVGELVSGDFEKFDLPAAHISPMI